jgi:hypothetical protein
MRAAAVTIGIATVLAACDAPTTGPAEPPAAPSLQAALSAADLGGSWTYERELIITAPPWVAELIFGVQPEGSVTRLRCEDTGTLVLNPDGAATFTGSATKQAGSCTTAGGQTSISGFPDILVVDGIVRGQSVRFTWLEDGFLVCPYHAVVSGDAMNGTGRCVVPGHPQSPVPADPPPAGTSKTVSFRATR